MLLEQEFIRNQEVFKPSEESNKAEIEKMEDIRASPMQVQKCETSFSNIHVTLDISC
jgi:hypothetical protein